MFTLILNQFENGIWIETLNTTGTLKELEFVEVQLRAFLKGNDFSILIG